MKNIFAQSGVHHYRNSHEDSECYIESHQLECFRYSEISLTTLHNVRLWTDNRVICVYDSSGQIIQEVSLLPDNFTIDQIPDSECEPHNGSLCLFKHLDPHNYYHWLIDSAANFGILKQAELTGNDIDSLYIHRVGGNFFTETIARTPFQKTNIVSYTNKPVHLSIPVLHVPSFNPWPNPSFSQHLKDLFLEKKSNDTSTPKKIYISRGDDVRRGVVNEPEIRQALESHGFETVVFQNLSVAEQAAMVHSAEVIIAPHGAGLANICFAKPNTQIIEFCGSYISSHFRILSELCNLSYYAIPAGIDDNGKPIEATPHGSGRSDSYYVDVDKIIRKTLSLIKASDLAA